MKPILLTLGLTCICASLVRADFNPVPLTPGSYTFDIVVEKTAPPALPYCITATQGGGTNKTDSTWFEQGFWRSPNQNFGVPHPGQTFTHQSNPNIQFIMPPTYLTNNGLLCDGTQPGNGGTLTLATPTTCSGLSIFGSSGGGNGTFTYTVTHADASQETGTIVFNDWFNGANPAWTALGRVGPNGGEQNNGSNPRLYSSQIVVPTNSPVVSVAFVYGAVGGTPAVYAISTTTDGTHYTPVVVTGFNQQLIVPAAFPLTATMDQGTNTVANGNLATWFEGGYVSNSLAFGLPPSGSTFNSLSQPTHHYMMGNYSSNNAILIDTNHQIANITPAVTAPYTAFALLTAGGNVGGGKKMTNTCILQHADGVNETNDFIGYDWFEGSVPSFVAFVSNGRVNMQDRTINALGTNALTGNPKLFETYFVLADTASPVTNIVLKFKTAPGVNSTTYIMAVSATAGGIPPLILTQPSRLNTFQGNTAQFHVTLGAGTSPVFNWQKASSPAGPFVNMTDGGNISGSTSSNLSLANVSPTDAGYYQVIVSNALGSATSAPPVALYLLTSTNGNVLLPGGAIDDTFFLNNIPPNPGETAPSAIDGTMQKYECFGSGTNAGGAPFQGPVGFVVTPGSGNTIVTALRIFTANDAPERDPADIQLDGSNDGGSTWVPILADTLLSLPDDRNAAGPVNITNQFLQEVDFANTIGYLKYKVTINNVKTNATANSMALAELQLLGVSSGPPVVITPFSLPENNIVVVGSTAKLSVGVAGTQPITNQWTFNNVNLTDSAHISGSQSNVLTITNVQFSDAGYYQLNLTNSAGHYTVYPAGGADQNLVIVAATTLFTNGFGWSATGNPALAAPIIAGNILTLTDGNTGEARAAFFGSPMYIGAFQASFIYQDVGGQGTNNTTADGVTFCLQNDTRGTAALGAGGGALAVSTITPSVELAMNIYNGAPGGPGMALGTNGVLANNPYLSTAPVDFSSGDPIAVMIVYQGGTAKVTFTDMTTNTTFSTNVAIGNLPTMLGAQTAYVGFTGATGGIASTQTITDFAFVPLTTLSATVSGSNLVLTWPVAPGGYVLQSESSVTAGSWSNVASPVTQAGGQNQVTVPLTGAQQYYRLSVQVPAP